MHTERMNETGMELAKVRRRVVEASRDYEAFEAYRNQLVRGVERRPEEEHRVAAGSDRRPASSQPVPPRLRRRRRQTTSPRSKPSWSPHAEATTTDRRRQPTTADDSKAALKQAEANTEQVAEVTKRSADDGWRIDGRGIGIDNPEGVRDRRSGWRTAIENVADSR